MGALVVDVGGMRAGVVEHVDSRVVGIVGVHDKIIKIGGGGEVLDAGFIVGVTVSVAPNLVHGVFTITVHGSLLDGLDEAQVSQHTASCKIDRKSVV